jgi:hypothetical protein
MSISENNRRKISTAIASFLMVTVALSLIALPAANAHDPAWEIPTYAYVNVSPDLVGVGQTVTIVVWIDKVLDGAVVGNDIRFEDYKLTITAPDETTETITWEIVTDTTSSAYTQYTPDQTGTYTLLFEFPGLTYTWTDPVPSLFGPSAPSAYINDVYLPSSAETTLVVQEEPISSMNDTPLPTEYWTRPIEGQNTNWYSISSNWLGTPGSGMASTIATQSDGAAPTSAHIMWTKVLEYGGVVGGTTATTDGMTYYNGLLYEAKFGSPIIINGRLYYALPESNDASGGGYICVDLRTGEEYWTEYYTSDPTFGQLFDYQSCNQHGVISNGYLWAISGTTWMAYDPIDGSALFNLTNVPSGTTQYGPSGEILIYQIDTANGWLALWNSTEAFGSDMISYRPVGLSVDASNAYTWNVTIPSATNVVGSTIQAVIYDDMILGSSTLGSSFTWGTTDPYTFWAISIAPSSRGDLLWVEDYDAPTGNVTRIMGVVDEETRVFTLSEKETMVWHGYDLDTGEEIWGPTDPQVAFDYYGTVSNTMKASKAYGNMYYAGYGGVLYCYDLETGDLVYSYGNGDEGNSTSSGFETAYGRYPLAIGNIADGKIYVYTTEHSPNAPLYKGAMVRCLNATTGEELWTMMSWAGVSMDSSWPIADGYMAYLNSYDMRVYCIGKGPSQTTVTASPKVSVHGSNVLVEGTVIDTATGTTQDEQAARFPNGVAAVSDESMSDWMEYVYMQKPKPTDVTGVEVILTVLDPNGNYYEVGTTTSDASGLFSCAFTPPVPGTYTVIATFEGTEGYYGSYAETAINVEEAPAPTAEPTPTPAPMTDLYVTGFGIGMILAIVAIGLVIILMLRKR